VDSLFSPIRKVNFEVENMRVGDRTDYNRLRLDLETDGSISAQDAFLQACKSLVEQFSILGGAEEAVADEAESSEKENDDEATKTKVEDLKLSTRTINSLVEGGIKTAGGLAKKSESALRELEGMGEKGIGEVKKALKKLGLSLKEE
jgi:DNA-directed RNA polymerase subunit alpha